MNSKQKAKLQAMWEKAWANPNHVYGYHLQWLFDLELFTE